MSARPYKDKASKLLASGKIKEARAMCQKVLQMEPHAVSYRVKLGDMHRKLGEKIEAVNAYEVAAKQYAEDGLLLKAIAVSKLILQLDANHFDTHILLADLYARKRSTAASPAFTEPVAISQPPPSAEPEPVSESSSVLSLWPVSQPVEPSVESSPMTESIDIDLSDLPDGDEPLFAAEVRDFRNDLGDAKEVENELVTPAVQKPEVEERPAIPLFSELPKRAFIEILVRMTMHELRAGEVVITEGELGDSFYVLASGQVTVSRKGEGAKEVILAHLEQGAFFGEMALLQDGVRTATVRVTADAQIFEISRTLLEELIATHPTVAAAVKSFYRQRLLASVMATHPLFSAFPIQERRALMQQFKSRSFAPGEVILEQGKKGAGLFLLLHGAVEVVRQQEEETIALAQLASGDLFGERSLLTGEPTNASVTAIEDVFVLRLSKKRFDEVIVHTGAALDFVASLKDEREAQNQALARGQLEARGAVMV